MSSSPVGPSSQWRTGANDRMSTVDARERASVHDELTPPASALGRPRSCAVPGRPLGDRDRGLATRRGRVGLHATGPSGCGRTLRRREHAQTCRGRDHTSTTVALRPRRASCVVEGHPRVAARCGPPAARMATTVIRTALPGSAGGDGYGRRSAEWGRPVSTVQPGVRSVRGGHMEWLRPRGVTWIHAVDRKVSSPRPRLQPGSATLIEPPTRRPRGAATPDWSRSPRGVPDE